MKKYILDKKAFGDRLYHLRKLHYMTQREVGHEIDLSAGVIRAYEAGRALPKISGLYEIAKFFDVTMEWLITGNKNVTREFR